MVYLFNSLQINKALNPGDHIAIMTPIFSPYLEIPVLREYALVPVYIESSEELGWQIPDEEISKLADPRVKALFMVNPTNPTSVSLDANSVTKIAETIRTHNRDMIVISGYGLCELRG
jgi:aspartate 4-decarboxylase